MLQSFSRKMGDPGESHARRMTASHQVFRPRQSQEAPGREANLLPRRDLETDHGGLGGREGVDHAVAQETVRRVVNARIVSEDEEEAAPSVRLISSRIVSASAS